MEVASMATFQAKPERFWKFHRPRIDMLASVDPNPAHHAVAEMQRRGVLHELVTQNIDRLHSRAGSPDPIEIHGSLDRGTCIRCRVSVGIEVLVARADDADDGVPRCDACGYQMKSGVILFGEAMPEDALEDAFSAADAADVILVIGTSLQVAPVSQLPGMVLGRGGRLAILTESETPYDHRADVRLHGKAGVQLSETLAALDDL